MRLILLGSVFAEWVLCRLLLHSSLEACFHWVWAFSAKPSKWPSWCLELPPAWPDPSGLGHGMLGRGRLRGVSCLQLIPHLRSGVRNRNQGEEKMFVLTFLLIKGGCLALSSLALFLWVLGPTVSFALCSLLNLNSLFSFFVTLNVWEYIFQGKIWEMN